VLGDVGVRFGGSEHHRIETSSSHTRPPPFGVGTPGHRDRANGALRSTGRRASVRSDKRRSSEHRASSLAGQGNPSSSERGRLGTDRPVSTHFDWGRAPTQRGTADGALRSTARRTSGAGDLALFGARATPLHRDRATSTLRRAGKPVPRDRATDTLRSVGEPVSPGQGTSGSSESRAPHPTGQGTDGPSGPTAPHPTGTGRPDLFGGSAPPFQRVRITPPHGTRQPALLGAPRAESHRDGPPPSGQSRRFPSGSRELHLNGTGNQRLFGVAGTPPRG
jgi:hypothetical protein